MFDSFVVFFDLKVLDFQCLSLRERDPFSMHSFLYELFLCVRGKLFWVDREIRQVRQEVVVLA